MREREWHAGPEKRLFRLDARLAACAGLVRRGAALADVGTDHAYLPVWLAAQGLISRAVAADVRPGPLAAAEANIRKYGVERLVAVRLSDGLDGILPHEAGDVVMAGMGGELIARLIARAAWLKDPEKRLILQPMTMAPRLRRALAEEGFALLREQAVLSGGKAYTVQLAAYAPEAVRTDPLFQQAGLLDGATEAGRRYLRGHARRLEKQARGLALRGDAPAAEALLDIARRIETMTGGGL